jgi:hypothetical protein
MCASMGQYPVDLSMDYHCPEIFAFAPYISLQIFAFLSQHPFVQMSGRTTMSGIFYTTFKNEPARSGCETAARRAVQG